MATQFGSKHVYANSVLVLNTRMSRSADLIIVGAGIAGAATAYYAAKRGIAPLVLDKGEVGGEQSSRAWGFVRQQERDPLELPMMMASNALWQDLESELDTDVEWRMSGNLGIARNHAQIEAYRDWQRVAQTNGLETRLLSATEVGEMIPGIRGDWTGALMTPSDGHASPPKTTAAFAAAAKRSGATIETGCATIALDVAEARVRGVQTERGYIAAERVVCAAGAWSARLLRPLGIDLPQLRVRASVGLTGPAKQLVPIASWTPEIAFRQRPDGVVVVARFDHADHDLTLNSVLQARRFLPTFRASPEQVSFHLGLPFLRDLTDRILPRGLGRDRARRWAVGLPPVNHQSPEHALTELKQLLTDARDLQIADRWSCYMDITADMLPVLGLVPGVEGLSIATGLSGHGFAMGPIVGKVSAAVALGEEPEFDLEAFSLSRWEM